LRNSVLDSFAVLAFLFQEPGHEKVVQLLEKSASENQTAFIAAPNWAEVRYQVERKVGLPKWGEVRSKLLGLPIEIVPADQHLAELAGEFKARIPWPIAFVLPGKREKGRTLYRRSRVPGSGEGCVGGDQSLGKVILLLSMSSVQMALISFSPNTPTPSFVPSPRDPPHCYHICYQN